MQTLKIKVTRQDLGKSLTKELKLYEVNEAYESRLINIKNELYTITDVKITGIDIHAIEFIVMPYSK